MTAIALGSADALLNSLPDSLPDSLQASLSRSPMSSRSTKYRCNICGIDSNETPEIHESTGQHKLHSMGLITPSMDKKKYWDEVKKICRTTRWYRCPVCTMVSKESRAEHFKDCGLSAITWEIDQRRLKKIKNVENQMEVKKRKKNPKDEVEEEEEEEEELVPTEIELSSSSDEDMKTPDKRRNRESISSSATAAAAAPPPAVKKSKTVIGYNNPNQDITPQQAELIAEYENKKNDGIMVPRIDFELEVLHSYIPMIHIYDQEFQLKTISFTPRPMVVSDSTRTVIRSKNLVYIEILIITGTSEHIPVDWDGSLASKTGKYRVEIVDSSFTGIALAGLIVKNKTEIPIIININEETMMSLHSSFTLSELGFGSQSGIYIQILPVGFTPSSANSIFQATTTTPVRAS